MRVSYFWRLLVALLAVAALLLTSCQGAPAAPKVGQQAPDLTLKRLDGQEMRLSDLRGKVVMLNFWATNCPPCRNEMPAMEAVYKELAAQGAVIVAVNQMEGADTVQRFVDSFGLTFTIALDQDGSAGQVYGAHYYPTTYVIDRDGIVRFKAVGEMKEQVIREYFTSLL